MRAKLLLGLLVGVAMLASCEPTETTDNASDSTKPAALAAGFGDPVRDGKFEFVVRKITCGKTRIGTADLGKSAQGQFCLVSVQVTNIGKEAQTLDGSSQYLYAAGGEKYSADTEAAIYLDDSKSFLNQINPGNRVDGIVIFDVPGNAKPAKLELHDSPFSNGATVDL